ncbi:TetR/AcrR family transcriptional regulator [Salipiger sp. PrR002]|uniref:acrylate utilization transcriptional regulator AcuR n=1 Tax=Salipiger sp. PrR002 TaxID=2706489 RepID=UPI0013B5B964|nr:TetR/AcrR family transcriptional regulator [Salipiger sp. PrR002]NDV98943.1 TetR family transcriptional regulator [Salipiger sp. PrR002]NDW59716.1 TetR family transcriptional regulator [Salipiger sp. PrR004]
MTQADSPLPRSEKPRRGRPRTAPDASEARRKLIRTGLEHLTEKGYSAVGVDEILKAAGVPKGSFYHHFKGKAEFGLALIHAYNVYFLELLDRAFRNEARPPLDRLRDFTNEAEAGMARHGFRRGCLVGNLGQEMGALPDAFRAALTEVLEGWQARTAEVLRQAQADGALAAEQDPEALAAFFWIGWEGAVLRAKLELSAEPLRSFSTTYFHLLER